MPSGKRSKANRRNAMINNPTPDKKSPHTQPLSQTPTRDSLGSSALSKLSTLQGTSPLTWETTEILELLKGLEEVAFEGTWDWAPFMFSITKTGIPIFVQFQNAEREWARFMNDPAAHDGAEAFVIMNESVFTPGALAAHTKEAGISKMDTEVRMLTWVDTSGRNISSIHFAKSNQHLDFVNDGWFCELGCLALNVAPLVEESRLAMDFVHMMIEKEGVTKEMSELLSTYFEDNNPIDSLATSLRYIARGLGGATEDGLSEWQVMMKIRLAAGDYLPEELATSIESASSPDSDLASKFRTTFGLAA
jgi:hypothetical protein